MTNIERNEHLQEAMHQSQNPLGQVPAEWFAIDMARTLPLAYIEEVVRFLAKADNLTDIHEV